LEPKILDSRLLASVWKLKLFDDILELPSGHIQHTPRLSLPDFVVVIALRKSDGKIALVNQYRHGSGVKMWELPAGHIEPKEKLAECAKREFREEIGFELLEPRLICSAYTSAPRSRQRAHVFMGYVGKKVKQELDETEFLTVKFVSPNIAEKLLARKVSATHLLAFLLAREKGLF
jgi:ADP-ribose pyrophosphatase